MSRTIELTRGYVTVVDDEDYEWLSQWKWCYSGGYAMRGVVRSGKRTTVGMHRVIMEVADAPSNVLVDHANWDTLDNSRANLRVCTTSQNQGNRRYAGGTSKYRGVVWASGLGKWRAQLSMGDKMVRLGSFVREEDAARAYNEAAVKHFGEFARLNNI